MNINSEKEKAKGIIAMIKEYLTSAKGIGTCILLITIAATIYGYAWGNKQALIGSCFTSVCWTAIVFINKYAK